MNRTLSLLGLLTFLLVTFGCNRKELNERDNFSGVNEIVSYETDSVQQPNITQLVDEELFVGVKAPDEVKPFITSPYVVQEVICGDINNDQLSDYIVVLVNPADDYNETPDALVPILFLVRQQDKRLKLHLRQENLIQLEDLRSALNSASIELDSTGTGFRITYHSQGGTASGTWDESTVNFTYSERHKDWLVESIVIDGGLNSPGYWLEKNAVEEAEERGDTAFLRRVKEEGYPFVEMEEELVDSEEDNYTTLTEKDFGLITLSKFKVGGWIFEF